MWRTCRPAVPGRRERATRPPLLPLFAQASRDTQAVPQAPHFTGLQFDADGLGRDLAGTPGGIGAVPVRRNNDVGIRRSVLRHPGDAYFSRSSRNTDPKTGEAPSSSAVASNAEPSGSQAAGFGQRSQSWTNGVSWPPAAPAETSGRWTERLSALAKGFV